MKKIKSAMLLLGLTFGLVKTEVSAQITMLQDYQNRYSAPIGTYQGIKFREAGFSGLFPIPGTNGKEFWTISDRGVNVDCANANLSGCRPTYDKMFPFPNYAPKIHRIRVSGDSIQILQTITMKRPNGTGATGLMNPTGYGSTATEVVSTDTVLNCLNFSAKTAAKDIWGIDSEGILVDADGNFWICEEGGPTIWKLNPNGVVIRRFTPFANMPGAQPEDIQIDTCFRYRKNNRGFECMTIAPNGKIYAIIQSPLLYPTQSVGEGTRIHRILEIDPVTNAQRMLVYLNDGIIGASGSNQIRLRDWKLGDLAAINDSTFLVLEAAARGTTDIKRLYQINIKNATVVKTGFAYGGKTLEALVDSTGLAAQSIKAVKKTLVADLLANGWPSALDKAEGLAILNDSTIAICNDNDFGQTSPNQDGLATATTNLSHLIVYRLSGKNKLKNFVPSKISITPGFTGPSSSQSPYLMGISDGVKASSILSVGDAVNGYKMVGIPDGLGVFDNGDGTFTLLMNHELTSGVGVPRAHGQKGAFVSKWVINKSTLAVQSGADLINNVVLWDTATKTWITYNTANPSSKVALTRFCSADLPPVSAFYNAATGLGTKERIFMNGEENNDESRAFAHVVTGAAGGNSYELPCLGKAAWENAVANGYSGDKTVVALTNDGTDGQVYFYIGTKTNSGTETDKAGLNNGTPWGVKVTGFAAERTSSSSNITIPTAGTRFSLVNLGNVKNMTGSAFNTKSNDSGVTKFSRPEDGAWDPMNPRDFYFNTTDQIDQVNDGLGTQIGRSRVWRLRFDDIANPEKGGTIEAVLDGTEGQNMLDNMAIDNSGHILLQEDVGNSQHNGKIWQYTIATDEMKQIAKHDVNRFGDVGVAASSPFNQDEESSGIIDAQSVLGSGMFLFVNQAHYSIAGELAEGGQLLALFNPETYKANPEISLSGNSIEILDGDTTPSFSDYTDLGAAFAGGSQVKSYVISNKGNGPLVIRNISIGGVNASDFGLSPLPSFPLTVAAGGYYTLSVRFAPTSTGVKKANLIIFNNDATEPDYQVRIQAISHIPGQTGPSTTQSPYLVSLNPGGNVTSILSVGDAVNGYKMVGIPDGLGVFDNGDGTFTLLMNHELTSSAGVARAHGQKGTFVSKWVISKSNLSVLSGADLIKNVVLWDTATKTWITYNTSNPSSKVAMTRFCSADLPPVSAFYNAATGLGTKERIFMNGEENNDESRAFAHVVTGAAGGNTYELPCLGKAAWENAVANGYTGDKTLVALTNDGTDGQVYFYIGTKTNSGTETDKAGLNNGTPWGVKVSGFAAERTSSSSNIAIPTPGTRFNLVNLGNVKNMTGAAFNTKSNDSGVTKFSRPEDGAWDPMNPRDFYFNTTDQIDQVNDGLGTQVGRSRVWRLRFDDIANPEKGGTIEAVLDGTEGQNMLDNMAIDNSGHILLLEDVGNSQHNGKIWQYTIATDQMKQIAKHDVNRFGDVGVAASSPFNQDEESSGIVDAQSVLGSGMFLLVNQAHYSIAGELAEGGQLLALYNPETFKSNPEIAVSGNAVNIVADDLTPDATDNTDFGMTPTGVAVTKPFVIKNSGAGPLTITNVSISGPNASELQTASVLTYPIVIAAGGTYTLNLKMTPAGAGNRVATVSLWSNDIDESVFRFAVQSQGLVPNLAVTGNSQDIADGDMTPGIENNTDFGYVEAGYATDKTFVITNQSSAPLVISNISFTGAAASDFSVVSAPAYPKTVGAWGTLVLTVRCSASVHTERRATLVITSNDPDNGTFEFALIANRVTNGVDADAAAAVKLYPNPASESVTIEVPAAGSAVVNLLNSTGQVVYTSAMTAGSATIALNNFSDGLYFVQVTIGGRQLVHKLLVKHN